MDQTEVQQLINRIEGQARTAVDKWAAEKNPELCPACLTARADALAYDVVVSALSFVADENEAGERCVEVMGFCDEEDEHAQAGGK